MQRDCKFRLSIDEVNSKYQDNSIKAFSKKFSKEISLQKFLCNCCLKKLIWASIGGLDYGNELFFTVVAFWFCVSRVYCYSTNFRHNKIIRFLHLNGSEHIEEDSCTIQNHYLIR